MKWDLNELSGVQGVLYSLVRVEGWLGGWAGGWRGRLASRLAMRGGSCGKGKKVTGWL